jgi:FkbM family methyltransferase
MAETAAQQGRLQQAAGQIGTDLAGMRVEMAETAAQQGRLQQAAGQIGTDLAGMRAEITAMTQAGEKVAELASAAASGANELLQSRAVPIGAEVLTRTPFGWLLVPAEDTRLVAAMIETGGSLEPGTASVLGAILEPGDLAVDIGGHVGTLALAMARAVGPTGRVLVLEPTPRNADLLRRTAIMTSMEHVIQVEQAAAGAAEGRSTLFFGVTTGHNSLIPIGETPDSVEVDVKPLDALLPPDALPVLIKIDAEGAELEIWRGMSRLIADAPDLAVVVEFGPSHLARQGISIGEWLSTVTDPGFTAWEIEEETGLIRPLRRDGLGEIFSVNLLLLRTSPSRWPRLKVAQE